jgi:hypothetical protein
MYMLWININQTILWLLYILYLVKTTKVYYRFMTKNY